MMKFMPHFNSLESVGNSSKFGTFVVSSRNRKFRVARRDVTNVKRSGEWLNMKSRNVVLGDLVKLTLGGLIAAELMF